MQILILSSTKYSYCISEFFESIHLEIWEVINNNIYIIIYSVYNTTPLCSESIVAASRNE